MDPQNSFRAASIDLPAQVLCVLDELAFEFLGRSRIAIEGDERSVGGVADDELAGGTAWTVPTRGRHRTAGHPKTSRDQTRPCGCDHSQDGVRLFRNHEAF
jgi:hypothetical protein